ncbi:MAG: hypothetical protein JW804_01170 [Sedimentisphaerales bacterium]|nr:hypothetical protein [Sedimentisphaerales bacterium]
MPTKRTGRVVKKKHEKRLSTTSHRTQVEWFPAKYFILEEILKKGSMEIDDLRKYVNSQLAGLKEGEVKKHKLIKLLKEVRKDVPELQIENEHYVSSAELAFALLKNSKNDTSEQLWKIAQNANDPSLQILKLLWRFNAGPEEDIYYKLKKLEENPGKKLNLVNKVCSLLRSKQIRHVMLSTGVTMFELARQIIKQRDELVIESIVSSNTLVQGEFLLSKISLAVLPLKMPPGLLFFNYRTASFGPERLLEQEESKSDVLKDVQASVLSFTSLSFENGFKIGHDYPADVNEKIIHLRPPIGCRLVIITIDWEKILSDTGAAVEYQNLKGRELFDVSNDREYIIVTDRPKDIISNTDRRRAADLKRWEEEGKAVVIDTDDKLKEYLKGNHTKG